MTDIDLLVEAIRNHGHTVGSVIRVPNNAGEYEIIVDGNTLTLSEVRQLLEQEETKK
jgi:hypothetical protein